MADQSDVENALTAIVANALYPAGTGAPSVTGHTCRVYRGSPTAPALAADLASGVSHVTVVAKGAIKNVTRYPRVWQTVAPVAASLTVQVAAESASFSGACQVGQLAGVAVDGALFPYAVQANDTAATVASNLAAQLRAAGWIVDYSGTTITVPAATHFTARVVNGAGSLQEIKRQVQEFGITLWCPNPASRDAAAPAVDEALAAAPFIPLSDGSYARMIFAGSDVVDEAEDATLYKRDLRYSAEYPTTLAQMTPAMLFGTVAFEADGMFVENLNA
jgi:hypothetical protein